MRTTLPIRSNGRIVVPSHIRSQLEVEDGDLVEIDVTPIEQVDSR